MKKIIACILATVLTVGLCACGQNGSTWDEQYDLGVRYLSDGNYEEAIIAFTAAIEIDPKRAEGYAKLADAYMEIGDREAARKALEAGAATTGDNDLLSRLDSLNEPKEDIVEEAYNFQTQVIADGLDVDAEHLTVRVRDGRTATITVGGLSLQDSYLTNLSTSEVDVAEYCWSVEMYGDQKAYMVSTDVWAFEPGTEVAMTITDMQHSVWVYDGDSWAMIGDAIMSYTASSITWTFTVPEEYPFDFAKVDRYKVFVYDISKGLDLTRNYTLG